MLPISGGDYLTEKCFEDPRLAERKIARRALIEKVCANSRRYGRLGCVLNKICALLGWVHLRS